MKELEIRRSRIGEVEIEEKIIKQPLIAGDINKISIEQIAQYSFLEFQRAGKQPGFFVIESPENRCSKEDLDREMYLQVAEQRFPHQGQSNRPMRPEEMLWYEMRNSTGLNRVDWHTTPIRHDKQGEGYKVVTRNSVELKEAEEAIKNRLGVKENVLGLYLERKRLEEEIRLDNAPIRASEDERKKTQFFAERVSEHQQRMDEVTNLFGLGKKKDLIADATNESLMKSFEKDAKQHEKLGTEKQGHGVPKTVSDLIDKATHKTEEYAKELEQTQTKRRKL